MPVVRGHGGKWLNFDEGQYETLSRRS